MGKKRMLRLCIAHVYSIAASILHVLETALIRSSPFFTLVKIPNQPKYSQSKSQSQSQSHSQKKEIEKKKKFFAP